jgi:hypothetical protein
MALTPMQRKLAIACALSHITRWIEAREGKASAEHARRGWLAERVLERPRP